MPDRAAIQGLALRLPPRPVLASVALHGVLAVAMLQIRYDPVGETSAFNVIQVEWVRSGQGEAFDGVAEEGSRTPEPAAETAFAPPEAVPPPADAPVESPPEPVAAADSPAPEPPPEPEPLTAAEEPPARPEPLPPAPAPAQAAASAAEPALERPEPSPSETPPGTALSDASPAEVVAADAPVAPAAPPPAPAAEAPALPADAAAFATLAPRGAERGPARTTPIPERQREMLDRRLERLLRDLPPVLAAEESSVSWEHGGQTYTATVTAVPAADDMGIDEVRVEVRTARSGEHLTTEMRWQRLAFSHYAQFVDRWDPEVQIHDDEIDGRFHSNSEIYVANSAGVRPTFHGKVTTAREVNTSYSTGRIVRSDVFRGGLETRVGRIALPRRFLPFETEPPADGAGVWRFAVDSAIVFHADGTYAVRTLDGRSETEQRHALGDEPAYLLAGEDVELHVSGIVNGKVLVHSPKRIVIVGNLEYAADSRTDPAADDYLGLVSDGSIEIAEPAVTGPGDLTIQAAMFAKRRFQVRSYRSRGPATLAVYGSVTAGSVSATEPRYRTRLEFDPRLEAARPPRFPMTGRYELADWSGEWQVEPRDEAEESVARETERR